MPSDLQVSNIKDLTGSNTGLSIASDGQVTISQNNPTVTLGSNATFPAGHVIQTLSGVKTDPFTTAAFYTSSGGATITGLSVSITPSSASNKILVITHLNGAHDYNANRVMATLFRDTTKIAVGGGSIGSRQQVTGGFAGSNDTIIPQPITVTYLDSPSSTSALTYTWKIGTQGSGTAYVNRSAQDSDETTAGRTMSTIIVQEIKA